MSALLISSFLLKASIPPHPCQQEKREGEGKGNKTYLDLTLHIEFHDFRKLGIYLFGCGTTHVSPKNIRVCSRAHIFGDAERCRRGEPDGELQPSVHSQSTTLNRSQADVRVGVSRSQTRRRIKRVLEVCRQGREKQGSKQQQQQQ